MYENINAIFESRKHYHPLKIKPSARSVYSKLNANIYAENYTSWQSISSINADDFRYSSLLSLFLENSSQKILVWIFDAEHFSRFDGQIERAQHRSLERSWEIFWQPKWVSVSSVMSRSIRSLQTVYPQWVKIAPHIDATGIRGIIDVCVYLCIYIYFAIRLVSLPSTRNTVLSLECRVSRDRGREDPNVSYHFVSITRKKKVNSTEYN